MDFKPHADKLLFLPLGGSNEIGLNLNLYQFQGKWIAVDFGIGFTGGKIPGVDIMVPNIDFLTEIKDDLLGMFITHAHEDHYGAIPYLWNELECPLYATPFTATMLESKMAGIGVKSKLPITLVESGKTYDLAPFSCEIIEMTHSVPEMHAIAIRAGGETIVHTGDWRLDPAPTIGSLSDENRLKEIGDEGVLALLCDSTNVHVEGKAESETMVGENLAKIIKKCDGKVAVATFASNVARVESIVKAGREAGRKIGLAGRSLWRVTQAAQENGYLQGVEFLTEDQAASVPRNELLLICTGCQGEDRAAMGKLAYGKHRTLKLSKGDTVIFSSKIIPGNHLPAYAIQNQFIKQGIEVITEQDDLVHVSGHPGRDELKCLYELVRPKVAIPVHGEARHIHEHAVFAKEKMGVPQVVEIRNGVVLDIAAVKKIGNVKVGTTAIDGSSLIDSGSGVLKTRSKMENSGCVCVSLVMDKSRDLVTSPMVSAPGLLSDEDDEDILMAISEDVESLVEDITRSKKNSGKPLHTSIRHAVRKFIKRELDKNPVIEIHVLRV